MNREEKWLSLLPEEWHRTESEVQETVALLDKYLDNRNRGKVRELGTLPTDPTILAVYPADGWSAYEFQFGFPISRVGVIKNVTTIAQKRMLQNKGIRTDLLYYGRWLSDYFPRNLHSRRDALERLSLVRNHNMILYEIIIRFNLVGSMWRAYAEGKREFCGHHLPDGMTRGQELPEEFRFTPTTKAKKGHDINVTVAEVEAQYPGITKFANRVGNAIRENVELNGGRLIDIKIEVAYDSTTDEFILCDEISPDSCRFCLGADYARLIAGEDIDFYDKEFGRQWAAARGARALDPLNAAHIKRVAAWRPPPEFIREFLRRYEVACTFLAGQRTSSEYLREVMLLTHV